MAGKHKSITPLTELTAITPLDGRYRNKLLELSPYFSESSLIRTRLEIETYYLIALSSAGVVRKMSAKEKKRLNLFWQNMSFEDVKKAKEFEEETRHDVKAMERVFRLMLQGTSLEDITEKIHLGLTSEDINNIAYRLMLKRATQDICIPILDELIDELVMCANWYKKIPMLARTHGQPAVPTTLGKEFAVFAYRLNGQVRELEKNNLTAKLTGAVGNLNALLLAYPQIDWINFSENFIKSIGFEPNLITTQVNPYDDIIAYFQNYQRINSILINFDQDMWRYVSDNWFVQQAKAGEVGSSTMPQKVNPIDFENSEGNLGIANGVIEFFVRKLPISRLQRDLSDSTVIRNMGTVLGYSLVGYKGVLTGTSRIKPNLSEISKELNKDYSILSEGVQTVLRKAGVTDSYSLIASLTRGKHLQEADWVKWVHQLPINTNQKMLLEKLTPGRYIGLAIKLTERAIKKIKSSRRK